MRIAPLYAPEQRKSPPPLHSHVRDDMLHKPQEVIYSSPAKGRITLLMQKAYNLMLKSAARQGLDQDWYEIPTLQLAKDLAYDSHDMAFLEESLDRMQTTLVKWEVRDAHTNRIIKNSVQLMGKVQFVGEISNSGKCLQKIIRYRFDEDIKLRLLNPETFAVLDTALMNRFSRRYALSLYEILMYTLRNTEAAEEGWTYTESAKWEYWRDILIGEAGASSTHFTQFKYFNRDVVLKALTTIKEVATEIEADCLVAKTGRTVSHLQFKVKLAAQGSFDLEDTTPPIDTSAIVQRLRALGLPHNVIQRHIRKYPIEDLESAAEYTENRIKRSDTAGPLDSVPAYLTNALSNRYWISGGGGAAELEKPKRKKELSYTQAEAGKDAAAAKFTAQGEQHYEELDEEAKRALLNNFIASEASMAVVSEYRTKGLTTLVKKSFFHWLGMHYSAP